MKSGLTRPLRGALGALLIAGAAAPAGCADEYGHAAGSFGQLDVRGPADADYYLVHALEFEQAFPDNPRSLQIADANLTEFLAGYSLRHANAGMHAFRIGQYYIAHRCSDTEQFQPVTIVADPPVQTITLDPCQ